MVQTRRTRVGHVCRSVLNGQVERNEIIHTRIVRMNVLRCRLSRPDATDYYCIDIPDRTTGATVTLSDLSDSMEVIVLRPGGRVWRSGFGSPENDAVAVIDEIEPGAHIIDVVIPSGRTSGYTITIESS